MNYIISLFYFLLLFIYIQPATAQSVRSNCKLTVFDKKSNTTKKLNGKLYLSNVAGGVTKVKISTRTGKTICDGSGSGGSHGASFTGKCFGIPAVAKFTFRNEKLSGTWKYKGSWLKIDARIAAAADD